MISSQVSSIFGAVWRRLSVGLPEIRRILWSRASSAALWNSKEIKLLVVLLEPADDVVPVPEVTNGFQEYPVKFLVRYGHTP